MPAATRQKDLGAFYTPEPMAAALVDWAIQSAEDTVLDPSFGGLVFLAEADRRLRELGAARPASQIFGCDLDSVAFEDAAEVAAAGATLVRRDFLTVAPDGRLLPRVAAVVGNPPYVRYQSFTQGRDRGRQIAARHGVRLTRLASSWAPLLVHAADFVRPGGRLAQVLPAELMHAQYAEQVLACICRRFERVVVAVFDEHVFPGAQEEVVLLLASGCEGGPAPGAEVLSFRNLDDFQVPARPGPIVRIGAGQKLLIGLLDPRVVDLYEAARAGSGTHLLGDLASVDIGAVTGANSFFVRSADRVLGLPEDVLRPAVSKASHVRGARFRAADLEALDRSAAPSRMIVLDARSDGHLPPNVQELVAEGEQERIHERYKCRVRSPWWALPLAQVADPPALFLTYMSNDFPRLVSNEVGALNTNTLHGVRLRNGTDPAALAAAFYSSITMLSAELVGRSYGGGVLKLEPTEAERLVIPRPAPKHRRLLNVVDRHLRERRYDQLLAVVDQAILIEDIGVSPEDVALLRSGVMRLRGRRLTRARRRVPVA